MFSTGFSSGERDGSRMMVRFLGTLSWSCHPARSIRTTPWALAATLQLIGPDRLSAKIVEATDRAHAAISAEVWPWVLMWEKDSATRRSEIALAIDHASVLRSPVSGQPAASEPHRQSLDRGPFRRSPTVRPSARRSRAGGGPHRDGAVCPFIVEAVRPVSQRLANAAGGFRSAHAVVNRRPARRTWRGCDCAWCRRCRFLGHKFVSIEIAACHA